MELHPLIDENLAGPSWSKCFSLLMALVSEIKRNTLIIRNDSFSRTYKSMQETIDFFLRILFNSCIFSVISRVSLIHIKTSWRSIIRQLAFDSNCADYVRQSIAEIVKESSRSQSIKGIFTAGIVKSVLYSSRKVQKMMDSKKWIILIFLHFIVWIFWILK